MYVESLLQRSPWILLNIRRCVLHRKAKTAYILPELKGRAEKNLPQGTQKAKAGDCRATKQGHREPASPSFGRRGGGGGGTPVGLGTQMYKGWR